MKMLVRRCMPQEGYDVEAMGMGEDVRRAVDAVVGRGYGLLVLRVWKQSWVHCLMWGALKV